MCSITERWWSTSVMVRWWSTFICTSHRQMPRISWTRCLHFGPVFRFAPVLSHILLCLSYPFIRSLTVRITSDEAWPISGTTHTAIKTLPVLALALRTRRQHNSRKRKELKMSTQINVMLKKWVFNCWPLKVTIESIVVRWRFGVAVTRWSWSTQLLYIEPG